MEIALSVIFNVYDSKVLYEGKMKLANKSFVPLESLVSCLCVRVFWEFSGGNLLGVIFTGGESPASPVIRKALDGKNALIIAADSGLIPAEEAGVKPDWIIGDMDSLGDDKRLRSFPDERVIRYGHEKDYTDTELAFNLAVEKGCDKIWIIGGGGDSRIDHLFAIRSLFERELFPCRWITAGNDIYCINAGAAENTLSLKLAPGTQVSVFPLGAGPWEALSEGLKWPLAGLLWDRGFFGLSNEAVDGDFSIKAEKGRFMVIYNFVSLHECF